MTDELLEMQKDTFKGLLIVTWVASLVALWFALFFSLYTQVPVQVAIWVCITPLNFVVYVLSRQRFRLATWIWVCATEAMLVLFIPWLQAPQLGPMPYGFMLMVVVSGLLISRSATLYIAGLASLLSLAALLMTGLLGKPLNVMMFVSVLPPLVMAWVTAVLSWISSDQLVTALEWTRNAQREANIQAENLRQSRDELRKSLQIRETLNSQLQDAHQQVMQRAVQLETVAEVSRRITSLLDFEQLSNELADLICAKFGYYYTGVFLLEDDPGEAEAGRASQVLALRASGGELGALLLQQGLGLPLDHTSINGCAAVEGHIQCVNDVTVSPFFKRMELLRETISETAIPLRIGERIVGTLDVQSKQINAFSKDDVTVLQGLGDQVAIAIQNTRLYESELARRQVAETLREVGHILSSTLDLDAVLDSLLAQLASVVPNQRTAVMLQSGDVLSMAAVRGYDDVPRALETSVDIRTSDVFSRISASRQVLVIADIETYDGWQQIDWLPLDHSWVGAPLISQDEVIGMLSLTRREKNAFSAEEGETVFTFANQAAIAIHNARLYEQVRAFNQQLEQKVQDRTAELKNAYQLLERLDQNKSDFIQIAAHELRTPLTVMKGYTDMMKIDPLITQNPYLGAVVDGVVQGTQRLHEIVNSMLDVARIFTGVLDLHVEPTDISLLIQRIHDGFKPALEERYLTLRVEDLSGLSYLQGDADLLYKVFYHIIINAIKYTPDGGSIHVSGQRLHDEQRGDCIQIAIRDTGIGIDPEHHELIFETFYQTGTVQLHSSGKTKFKGGGPGLGLAIVRGVVLAHGGHIWVESAGHDEIKCPGSCFYVRLPVAGPKKILTTD